MTIYDRLVWRMLADLYWEARSREARRRYDRRGMRSFDLRAFERFYKGVERIRPYTFNPFADILVERYVRVRKELGRLDGIYEELGYPYNI